MVMGEELVQLEIDRSDVNATAISVFIRAQLPPSLRTVINRWSERHRFSIYIIISGQTFLILCPHLSCCRF